MTLIVEVLILIANLAVTGLGLKLYTEILKEKSQRSRRPAYLEDVPPGGVQ